MPGLVASLQEDWEVLFRFFSSERDRSTCVFIFSIEMGCLVKKKTKKTFCLVDHLRQVRTCVLDLTGKFIHEEGRTTTGDWRSNTSFTPPKMMTMMRKKIIFTTYIFSCLSTPSNDMRNEIYMNEHQVCNDNRTLNKIVRPTCMWVILTD